MGDVLFFGGLILMIASLVYLVVSIKKVVTNKIEGTIDYKKEMTKIAIINGAFALSTLIFFIGIPLKWHTPMNIGEWVMNIFGGLFTGLFASLIFSCFYLHYYKKDMPKKLDHRIYQLMFLGAILIIPSIWVLTEAFANHMTYPLANGLKFNPFGLAYPTTGGANVAWYALCILGGAVIVYFVCDHFMYKEYGKHGILESTFFIALPAGIIGARIGYVIGNWHGDTTDVPGFSERIARGEWWSPFAIWEGGLTIVSGAIIGILVGVAWFMWRNKGKGYKIGTVVNIVVPAILIAQGVGRWGNFFNIEVHGEAVSGQYFAWLPSIIYNNMQYSSSAPSLVGTGNIYAPLFLIESMVNFIGYFVLFFGVAKGLKKYIRGGDAAFGYVIWYGLTRTFMEPLRYGAFNMGTDGAWSWIWSIIYASVGTALIVGNHLFWYFYDKKKNNLKVLTNEEAHKNIKYSIIGGAIISVIALVGIIGGFILFFNNSIPAGTSAIALVPHNIGLIMWILGLTMLLPLAIPIMNIYEAKRQMKGNEVVNG